MKELTTQSLAAAVADDLGWLADEGFKYYKSFNHFSRKHEDGFSYIAINAVTHNRFHYHVAFYLAVQLRSVEQKIRSLYGDDRKLDHYDRTIWLYTVNMGPQSPNWSHPLSGTWSLRDFAEYGTIRGRIVEFVRDVAIPYVTANEDRAVLRQTLLEEPGHATHINPYEPILTIDLLDCPGQIDDDIAVLEDRYRRYAKGPMERFRTFVDLVRKDKAQQQHAKDS
jgi:hypothetical protein